MDKLARLIDAMHCHDPRISISGVLGFCTGLNMPYAVQYVTDIDSDNRLSISEAIYNGRCPVSFLKSSFVWVFIFL